MATDSTNNQNAANQNAANVREGDIEQVQLTQSGTPIQVQLPQGENLVRVQVTPGETVQLPFPADGLVARLGDNGNLAVKVGDVTVILVGYADAAGQGEVPLIGSDGRPVDVAAVLAATDPDLDIQTAAGPGAGDQGTGPDNNGGLFSPFDPQAGIGGLNAIGGLDPTQLNYNQVQRENRLYIPEDGDTSPMVVSIEGIRVVNEDDLGEGGYGQEREGNYQALDSFNEWQAINNAFQEKYGEDTEVDCDFHYWWFGEYYDEGNDPFDTKDHEEGSDTDWMNGEPDDGVGALPDDNNGDEANGIDQDREPTSVTAKVTINFFSDVPGTVSFSKGGSTPIIDQLEAMNLTSHSEPLQYMLIPGNGGQGDMLVAYVLKSFGDEGSCCYANVVFTIAIDHDTSNTPIGEFNFTFTIYGVIDNGEKLGSGADGEDVLTLPTPFFMVDSDGSTVLTQALTFDDVDDVPQLGQVQFDWVEGGGNNDEGSNLYGDFYAPDEIIPTDTDLVHDETGGKQNNGNEDGVPGPDNDPGASVEDEDDTNACVHGALEAAGMEGYEGEIIGAARIRPHVSFGADGPAGQWLEGGEGNSESFGPSGYVGNKEAGETVFPNDGGAYSTAFQLYIGDPENPVTQGATNWTITYDGQILQVMAEQTDANTIVGYAVYKPQGEALVENGDGAVPEIRVPVFVIHMDPEAHNGWDYNGNLTFVQLHQINHVDPLNPDESSAPLQIYPEGYEAPVYSYHDEFNSLDAWAVLSGGSAEIVGDIGAAGNQPNPANQALLLANGGEAEEGGDIDGSSVGDIEDFFGLADGTLAAMMDDGDPDNDSEGGAETPTDGTAIRQVFDVTAGETLTVKFNFLEDESDTSGEGGESNSGNPSYQDFAFIVIGDQVFRLSDVNLADLTSNAEFGNWSWDEESGYLTFTHVFTESGPTQIGFGVMNEDDSAVDPALLIDELSIGDPQVPGSEIKFRATDYDGDYVDAPVSIVVQDDGPVLVGVDYDNCQCQGEGVNLIQNGSFEDTPVIPYGTHGIFTSIPGWQSDGGEGGGFEVQNHAAGDPQDGSQHAELDGNYNSNMYQDVATSDGEAYTLSLWYTPRTGDSSTDGVEVWFDGQLIATLDGSGMTPGVWQEFTYVVTAGNGDGTPDMSRLEFKGIGTSDGVGGYIDNVSLTLGGEACVGQIDEDRVNEQGNPGGPGDDKGQANVTGQVNVNFGTDQPGRFDLTSLKITDDEGNTVFDSETNTLRTATGQAVTVIVSQDGSEVVGFVDGEGGEEGQFDDSDTLVFQLTIDQQTGEFQYNLYEPLEHPYHQNPDKGEGEGDAKGDGQGDGQGQGSWEDNLHFTFGVKATDVDGDFITTEIEIDVDDDSPRICATGNTITLATDESVLPPQTDGKPDGDEDGGGVKAEQDNAPVHATLAGLAAVIGANSADGSQLFNYNAGADGEKSHGYALTAADGSALADGTNSGLTDTLTGSAILLFTETVDGVDVVVGRAGGADGPAVFAITIDGQSGELSIAQYRAVEHSDSPGDQQGELGENDEIAALAGDVLGVTLTVTDNDGDHRSLTVDLGETEAGAIVAFEDDGPRVECVEYTSYFKAPFIGDVGYNSDMAIVDEDWISKGNADYDGPWPFNGDLLGLSYATGKVNVDFGTDGKGGFSIVLLAQDMSAGVLRSSDDAPVFLHQNDDGEVVGYVGGDWTDPANIVFKLSLDTNSGDFRFDLYQAIEHANPEGENNDNAQDIDLGFTIGAKDGDGDQVTAGITVRVDDDSPDGFEVKFVHKAGDDNQVNESGIVSDSGDDATFYLDFGFVGGVGADQPGTVTLSLDTVITNLDGETIVLVEDGAGGYKGVNVNDAGDVYFTVTKNGNGSFTLDMVQSIKHSSPGDDVKTVNFTATVTDADGDQSSDGFSIKIKDDVPDAVNDGAKTVENYGEGVELSIGKDAGLLANDKLGADGGRVASVTYAGIEHALVGGTITFAVPHGSITVNEDGSWSFDQTSQPDEEQELEFSYKLVDGDGDVDNADFSINLSVKPANTAPVAGDDNIVTSQTGNLWIPDAWLKRNDTDAETPGSLNITGVATAVDQATYFTTLSHSDANDLTQINIDHGNGSGELGDGKSTSFTYDLEDPEGKGDTANVDLTYIRTDEGTYPQLQLWLTGTDKDDIVIGDGDGEIINGKNGDDILDGGGGSDVVNGGDGRDWIIFDAADLTNPQEAYNGGNGFDTLKVTTQVDISVTQNFTKELSHIEAIDLRNGQNDEFGNSGVFNAVDVADVMNISDSNTLYILGEAGDTVRLAVANWTKDANVHTDTDSTNDIADGTTFDKYTNSGITLYIQTGIDVETTN